jgi:hypothetical protein
VFLVQLSKIFLGWAEGPNATVSYSVTLLILSWQCLMANALRHLPAQSCPRKDKPIGVGKPTKSLWLWLSSDDPGGDISVLETEEVETHAQCLCVPVSIRLRILKEEKSINFGLFPNLKKKKKRKKRKEGVG